MNKREDILAEINMLKIMVWSLWEENNGKIKKKDWLDFKEETINRMRKSETIEEYESNKK